MLKKLRKADMALGDLASGGLLTVEQAETFIRTLIDTPTLLGAVRTIGMGRPSMELNKILFGSRIMRVAAQAGGFNDNGNPPNDRYLVEADRSKPTTSKVTLNTKEYIAEVHLPYEVLEDNIEKENLQQTIIQLIAQRAALDFEELLLKGDTGSGDTYLASQDGILKLATAHVVDAAGASISANIFNTAKKALPTKYRRNLPDMRYYSSMDLESDYRLAVSSRGTGLGDAILTGTQALPVFGIPLEGAALMPNTNMILTNPQNIIFGVQRQIRMELDRDVRAREIIIVLTSRVAIQIEETDAMVKVTNLGAA